MESFLVQYGGYVMSFGKQYYHAKKQSEEMLLEYQYRLNISAIRERIRARDGLRDVRREHVEDFIGTLDDRDLAKQLTLLGLEDADSMEEALRVYKRMENTHVKTSTGSSKA